MLIYSYEYTNNKSASCTPNNQYYVQRNAEILVWGKGGVTRYSHDLIGYFSRPLPLIGVALVTFVRHLHPLKQLVSALTIPAPNLNPRLRITQTESYAPCGTISEL